MKSQSRDVSVGSPFRRLIRFRYHRYHHPYRVYATAPVKDWVTVWAPSRLVEQRVDVRLGLSTVAASRTTHRDECRGRRIEQGRVSAHPVADVLLVVSHQHGGRDEEAIVVAEREIVGELVTPMSLDDVARVLQNAGHPASNALRLTIGAAVDDKDPAHATPFRDER